MYTPHNPVDNRGLNSMVNLPKVGDQYYYTNIDGEDVMVKIIFVDLSSVLIEESVVTRRHVNFNRLMDVFKPLKVETQ